MKIDKYSNEELRSNLKACADLELELCEEEYLRSYRFYPDWSEDVQVATYNNGCGDDLAMVFHCGAALIKGFDHESALSPHVQDEFSVWAGMYEGAPTELLEVLNDKALGKDNVTFCLWRLPETKHWTRGPVVFAEHEDDGSGWLLSAVIVSVEEYIDWAKYNYEEDFNCLPEERIYKAFAHLR